MALSAVDLRAYVKARRKRLRSQLITLKGGKCERCGYDKCIAALNFHHRDKAHKALGLNNRNLTQKWEVIVAEAMKCDLLCANCHMEEHYPDIAVQPSDECKAA